MCPLSFVVIKSKNCIGDDRIKKAVTYIKSIKYSIGLFYRSSKLLFLLYFFLTLLCRTIPLLKIYTLRHIINALIAEHFSFHTALIYMILYVVWVVLLQALNSAESITKDSVIQKANLQYDLEISRKMVNLPLSIVDTSHGRNIIDDVRKSRAVAVNVTYRLIHIISSIYTFIVAVVSLIAFNVWFSLAFIALTVPGVIINNIYDKKADEFQRKSAPDVRKFHYYRWMLTDAWPAKDVRMYDLTEPIQGRYDEEKKNYRTANKHLDWKRFCAVTLIGLITQISDIAFIIFVIAKAVVNEITVGDVTLYIGMATSATTAFKTAFTLVIDGYTIAVKRMERVFKFFNIKNPESTDSKRVLNQFESLVFDNVYFKYPLTKKYVLSGTSFSLNRGDKLSIVGINGSGKSTIIKLMLGLYKIESGQILINGYPMSEYDIKDIHKLFSVLFQNFVQYPLTLRDNIALSDSDRLKNDKDIIEALKKSDVYYDIQHKLENGIDSYMTRQFDDKGIELSKGQWQKIALSRTYFKDSPIIIFDEPSAALDAEAEDRIFKNFESISDGKTGIMISHRISSARISNKIIVLDGGKIIEEGTHDELVSTGGLYARLYNLQCEKYATREEK